MKPPIYVDLDNTLISGEAGPGQIIVYKRPGTDAFLKRLSKLGKLWLCTHGVRVHAEESLRVIGARDYFHGIICREHLNRVTPGRGPRLAPPGFMFDDYPVGSWLYDLKATALGIGPDLWIKVEKFGPDSPDQDGLRKAYKELLRRVRKSA